MGASFKAYKITDAAGVGQFLAVVQDTAAGSVKKPAAANAVAFIGITQEAQSTQNKSVTVQEDGETFAVAHAAIAVGDRVNIGANTGRLASCEAEVLATAVNPAANVNVVGEARTAALQAGDIFRLRIRPYSKMTPVS